MEYTDLVYTCALNRIFNYDCRLARKMADAYPSPGDLFGMGRKELSGIFGPDSSYTSRLTDRKILEDACAEVEWAQSRKVRILCWHEKNYPARLRDCPDAPLLLFVAGRADLDAAHVVSLVGTRRATTYGEDACRSIVEALSSVDPKPLIVSGLAYGIDICAHRRAMASGLGTVGVMATGIDAIYPSAHRTDAVSMCADGGIVTDFWRGAPPSKYNFLRRNRIIAGLCDALVLVESDRNGGGVVTSRMAYSYSREVFAVPGRMTDKLSVGCNALIAEKVADPLHYPGRICEVMGWKRRTDESRHMSEPELFPSDSAVKRDIVVTLADRRGLDRDSLIRIIGADSQSVMSALTDLELEGRIVLDSRGAYRISS